jgi:hypothetical protein
MNNGIRTLLLMTELLLPLAYSRIQYGAKRAPGAKQGGHHRAGGNVEDFRQLVVREPFQFAKYENLPGAGGQRGDRALDRGCAIGAKELGLRIGQRLIAGVMLFIEEIEPRRHVAAASEQTGIPDDPQKPGTAVAAGKGAEVPQGPQGRVLHGVLGVVLVSQDPSRKSMGRTKMRQHDVVEALTTGGPAVGTHPTNVKDRAERDH